MAAIVLQRSAERARPVGVLAPGLYSGLLPPLMTAEAAMERLGMVRHRPCDVAVQCSEDFRPVTFE